MMKCQVCYDEQASQQCIPLTVKWLLRTFRTCKCGKKERRTHPVKGIKISDEKKRKRQTPSPMA